MAKCREQVMTINNVRIWTAIQGNGIPLVLCHGGPSGYDYLQPVADMVDDLCQVVRYDQRGSGRSETKRSYNVDTFVEDLESLRRKLSFNEWIVCGHSWGAALALAYTIKYMPRVEALIYISGSGIDPNWKRQYHRNQEGLLTPEELEKLRQLEEKRSVSSINQQYCIKKEIQELIRKTDVYDPSKISSLPTFEEYPTNDEVNQTVGADWENVINDKRYVEQISSIYIPSLLIHGKEDPRPLGSVRSLSQRLPNSQFKILGKVGHYPWIEKPKLTRKILRDFIRENSVR